MRIIIAIVFKSFFNMRRFNGNFLTGFTVIELLVVVAIIAMIASAALALLSVERARARDATREQNIKTLQTALNLYAVNARTYPSSSVLGTCVPSADCSSIATCGEAITDASQAGRTLVLDGSAPAIPKDPINQGNYKFYYSSSGSSYTISYCLETDSVLGKKASGLYQAAP